MSLQEPLGIALLGCGGVAAQYRANYAHITGTVFRLAVDMTPEIAEQTARECGAERWSTDWRDALTDDIHIVDISTPNHLHAEQAVACLNAGKHIILQKPMAPTIAECKTIVETAHATGYTAGVYISDLEDAAIWDMRELVQAGYIGKVTGIRARYAHRGGLSAKPSPTYWRGSAEKTGGGSFIQLSIHHINLLHWVLEDRIESVMAYSTNLACPNIGGDDTTAAVCVFEKSGILGVLESAWNADGNAIQIYGTEGHVSQLGGQGGSLEVQTNRPFAGKIVETTDTKITRIPSQDAWHNQSRAENPLNQHIAFVEAVRDAGPIMVSAEVGMYDVAVCKAVYTSAVEGRRITIAEILA